MTPIKICQCGRKYMMVPVFTKIFYSNDVFQGWYWHCKCLSTLFIPLKERLMK